VGLAVAVALLLALGAGLVHAKGGKASLGKPAPWFKLINLPGTHTWTHKMLRGKPTVLVVGRTQKAAPPCKAWMLALVEKDKVPARVLQVIVLDKQWYHPRGVVLNKVKTFVPARHHDKVLLEWYTVFADVWGIPYSDDPTVYLLDSEGVVRFTHRGNHSRKVMKKLKAALEK